MTNTELTNWLQDVSERADALRQAINAGDVNPSRFPWEVKDITSMAHDMVHQINAMMPTEPEGDGDPVNEYRMDRMAVREFL